MLLTSAIDSQEIYTISKLNSAVRSILENAFPFIYVEGEISNFVAPHSGHWYFSLKDQSAQVRCAMFRGQQRQLAFTPKNGSVVLVKARVSLYENRGDFQLIIEEMEERGAGKLREAYEKLRKKLEALGWFDEAHKKTLPLFPAQIGVVTSATGAAIHDILTVLKRRFPAIPVIVYPTLVQGEMAAACIVAAIQLANERQECDVLIVARGGGSLEDLWPFNEEIVAKAIYESQLPIITGIGHEVDFTIADFVADRRAPTPSAAAEIVTPDQAELSKKIIQAQQRLVMMIEKQFSSIKKYFVWIQKHLFQLHPKHRLLAKVQELDFFELSLVQFEQRLRHQLQLKHHLLASRLYEKTPIHRIQAMRYQLDHLQNRLMERMQSKIMQQKVLLSTWATRLDVMNPLQILKRGYAIVSTEETHQVLRSVEGVHVGQHIQVQLASGELGCEVKTIQYK